MITTKNIDATITAGTYTLGSWQCPSTATVGDVVHVLTITTDGMLAYVVKGRDAGYVPVGNLTAVPAPARCAQHPAFDADYCPSCGTSRVIG